MRRIGCSLITSARMSQTSGRSFSTILRAALMVVTKPLLLQLGVDEGLEELERHPIRKTALMQSQLRTHHDHGTAGVIHALAEQVLPEASRLALEHVGEGLQRALAGAR